MLDIKLLNLIFMLFIIQQFQSSFGWQNTALFKDVLEKQFESSWPQILNTKFVILQPIIQLQEKEQQIDEQKEKKKQQKQQ